MTWQQRIERALDERRAAEAFRRRLPVSHGAGRWLEREGERWLNFSSNDYLGLSQHAGIIAAWQQGAERYGVGSGGVRGQRRGFWGQSGRTLFTNSIYYMKIEQVW